MVKPMDKSIFLKTMGDYPLLRVLDFLMWSRDFDYPLTEIATNSHVNFITFKKLWPRLEKEKIVKKTRKLGRSLLYRINEENPIVQKLIEFNNAICWKEFDEQTVKESGKNTKKEVILH